LPTARLGDAARSTRLLTPRRPPPTATGGVVPALSAPAPYAGGRCRWPGHRRSASCHQTCVVVRLSRRAPLLQVLELTSCSRRRANSSR
jgi:hypothetical protein